MKLTNISYLGRFLRIANTYDGKPFQKHPTNKKHVPKNYINAHVFVGFDSLGKTIIFYPIGDGRREYILRLDDAWIKQPSNASDGIALLKRMKHNEPADDNISVVIKVRGKMPGLRRKVVKLHYKL